jgi:hypothetical protein
VLFGLELGPDVFDSGNGLAKGLLRLRELAHAAIGAS